MLLENQCNLVDEEEGDSLGLSVVAAHQLILQGPPQQQGGDEGLSGT